MTAQSIYVTLFDLVGLAMPAWLLLILLPKWRFTQWIARTAIVPALISLVYLAGVALLVIAEGGGFMRDFGSAEGVTRLLARQEVAMVAWIHILAFDQLVALFIYRDNMRNRNVPIVAQSVILFMTLMFGPIGFLTYYLIRTARGRADSAMVDTRADASRSTANVTANAGIASLIRLARERLMMSRGLVITGMIGIVIGLLSVGVAALRGSTFIPPEGHLNKAASFCIAVGIYTLTLAFYAPDARFSERGRKIWTRITIAIMLWSYSIETIQIWRGIDPRFSRAGSPIVQLLGGVFFLTAVSLIVLFAILAWKYLRKRDDAGSPFVLAVRYGFAAVFAGFAAGFWLTANNGSAVAPAGSILPLHALGFHGMQAIPIIALLLMWAGTPASETKKIIHVAGISWLIACGAVAIQAASGRGPLELTPTLMVSGFLLLVWGSTALLAFMRWYRPRQVAATRAA